LIVISHGSGGSPWVHVDLARVLVARGYVVAIPQHEGDNYQDASTPGPVSWAKRPIEITQAIDSVSCHAAFNELIARELPKLNGLIADFFDRHLLRH
jgi:predicted dienelactone hydrolase